MKQNFTVGICGGSGSGKSTIADKLKKKFGENAVLIYLDDFYVERDKIPTANNIRLRDHPKAIGDKSLANAIMKLKSGKSIEIMALSPRTRKENDPPRKRVRQTINPKPIIIVEGFLLLHFPDVRKELDCSVYLDTDIEQSVKRRVSKAENEAEYLRKVVIPFHKKYVEPSAKFADIVIDVGKKSQNEVYKEVFERVKSYKNTSTSTIMTFY